MKTVDILIPVCRPPESFKKLPELLTGQSHPVNRVIILNTVGEGIPEIDFSSFPEVTVISVPKEEFDHAGTRNLGILSSEADLCLFLTQDAEPSDRFLVEKLVQAFDDPEVAVAYGRQLPKDDCRTLERLTRDFNYPAESRKKGLSDLGTLGIKTYFCSDVCAMYDRVRYLSLGGFVPRAVFNEDMIFACKAVSEGYLIAYRADASVKHSHNYSGLEQLRRNFDMGVSQAQNPDVFQSVSSESEGLKLVKQTAAKLISAGRWYLLPQMIWQSGMKYLGYRLGKKYRKLSKRAVLRITANPSYWRNETWDR